MRTPPKRIQLPLADGVLRTPLLRAFFRRRRLACPGVAVMLALLGAGGADCSGAETTASWLGGSGVWSDATRWSGGVSPANGQPSPADTYHALIGGVDDAVELDLDIQLGRLTLSAGILDLRQSSPLEVVDAFAWSGGTITSASGNFLDLGAGGVNSWSGTLALNRVRIANGGDLELADGLAVTVDSPDYEVNAGLRNLAGATVSLAGGGSWLGNWYGEGPAPDGFDNQGTLVKSGSGTFVVGDNGGVAMPFRNSGTVRVNAGVMQIDAPIPSATGAWIVAPDAELRFREVQTSAASSITGAGSVRFDGNATLGGSYAVSGPTTVTGSVSFDSADATRFGSLAIASSGSVGGTSALSVSDSLTWAGFIGGSAVSQAFALDSGAVGVVPADATFHLDTRTFDNAGTFTWTGGAVPGGSVFGFFGNAVFNNLAGGTFTAAGHGVGGSTGFPTSLSGTFNNAGTFVKTGPGTVTRLNWRFANVGLVDLQSGALDIQALSQPGGTFQVGGGTTLTLRRTDANFDPADDPLTGTYAVDAGGTLELSRGHLQAGAAFPSGVGTVALGVGASASLRVSLDALPATLVRLGATDLTPPSGTVTLPRAEFLADSRVGMVSGNTLEITEQLVWAGGDFTIRSGLLGGTGGTLQTAAGATTTVSGIGSIASATGLFDGLVALGPGSRLTVGAASGSSIPAKATFDGGLTFAPGSTLRVAARGTVESSVDMQVGDGAVIELNPGTTGTGDIDARLTGGSVTTGGTGKIRIGPTRTTVGSDSYAQLDNTAINGTLELPFDKSRVRLVHGANVTGTVLFSALDAASLTAFEMAQSGELDHLAFRDTTANASSRSAFAVIGGHTVTLGADVRFEGIRSILGDYFSSNTGQILDTGHSTIVNHGHVLIEGSGRQTSLAALDTFENRGTLEARNGATLVADREFTQTAGRLRLDEGTFTMSDPSYRASTRTLTLSGGTLEGRGTFRGTLNMTGGQVSPGASFGLLTIGSLGALPGTVSASGGAFRFELGGFTRGVSYDALDVSGAFRLEGPGPELEVTVKGGLERPIQPGDVFTLVLASTVSGSFANVANGGLLTTAEGTGSFLVHYGPDSAFGANTVVLSGFAPVPEPVEFGVVMLGVAFVVTRRLHRRRGPRHSGIGG